MRQILLLIVALLAVPGIGRGQEPSSCKYWLVAHGNPTRFWAVLQKGAQDAALSLGCTVQFYLSKGDQKAQQDKFLEVLAARPDGIALSIINDKLFDEPIANALAAGVPVVAVNNDDSRGAAGNKRLCYIGQDDENAAYKLTLLMIELAQKKGLDIFNLQTQAFSEAVGNNFNTKRLSGISRALAEFGMRPPKVVDLTQSRGDFSRKIESYLDTGGRNSIALAV
ncbi:MAG TPA: substrate-binding domain-containing protein, partial [Elusimicrobiales bacterium]|nr:substrate-binding domain-containing protein [Elusimicrobiales bacterium]